MRFDGSAVTDEILGRTFWSTVARVYFLFPVLAAVGFLIKSALVPSSPTIVDWVSLPLSLTMAGPLLGAGWGLAFWRYDERPVPDSWFLKMPVLSGLLMVPTMVMFVYMLSLETPSIQPNPVATDYLAAGIVGLVGGPISSIIFALFWRYMPQRIGLRKYG